MRDVIPLGGNGSALAVKPARLRSDAEFHGLLEMLPAGAYLCDPEGLITFYNQRAVELWGRTPKLGDPIDRF
jgi:PAS domain-containing protein